MPGASLRSANIRAYTTLPQIEGQGTCLRTVPQTRQSLCNQTSKLPKGNYYLIPSPGTWWACNMGLTPCVSTQVLKQATDYCVMTQILPHITYHAPETVQDFYEGRSHFKREPITMTLALLLGIGTGTAALIHGNQSAINADLEALENSISLLEKSLSSLSKVVLQNRRGLDLLFLKEGGLCAALKEECCFYADHSGVIQDSMAKLGERLKQTQHEAQQGWFEGWFNRSPWLTTLISTVMGPLIISLLLLTFGPCILNSLLQFIKDRLSVVQARVLTQQYQMLRQHDTELQDHMVSRLKPCIRKRGECKTPTQKACLQLLKHMP